VIIVGTAQLHNAICNQYEKPFTSITPDHVASPVGAIGIGIGLGDYWMYGGINAQNTSFYTEARLSIPQSFGPTDRHVIFETGGSGGGCGTFIYDGDLSMSISAFSTTDAFVSISMSDIPNFLGNIGVLGMSWENVNSSKWKVRLLWNGKIIRESPEADTQFNTPTGDNPGAYLYYSDTIIHQYNDDRLTFTEFPNATL